MMKIVLFLCEILQWFYYTSFNHFSGSEHSAQLSAWHTSIEEEELFNNSLKAYMRVCVNIAYLYFKTVA